MPDEPTPPAPEIAKPKLSPGTIGSRIPWPLIEVDVCACMPVEVAAEKYGVKSNTIRVYAKRHGWVLPKIINKMVRDRLSETLQKQVTEMVERKAEEWLQKGEEHRIIAFDRAAKSVKKFKPKAPKNFRELEAADKIARRAAGLDVSDVNVATLLQINEAVDNFDEPRELSSSEVIDVEATVRPVE